MSESGTGNVAQVIHGPSLFTDHDIYLFKQGTHFQLYNKLGSHEMTVDGKQGVYFAIWVPNARYVSVIGDFNNWAKKAHPLTGRLDESGIWEGFIPGIQKGQRYKYHIVSRFHHYRVDKSDPYGFQWEVAPDTASMVCGLDYQWNDHGWMRKRATTNTLAQPMSVYEVHLGSWRRNSLEDNRFLTYRELAHELAEYVNEMGFTHVEFMPVMEHPFYGSWGYQVVGYYAPTSRYGTPQDFMYLVDYLHQHGIGVILDWVPSHFPSDVHGLIYGDGTHLYEHADTRKGFHPDWETYIFNYGRNEVREFLISNAFYWFDKYHIDGLRVDAVASMLYLDYSREEGEWIPNEFGGREHLEAIDFLQTLNKAVYQEFPGIQMIAEESTAWPSVSRPIYLGGLGFGMKWNMGWMHDILQFMSKNPVFRKYHHSQLTFSLVYAFEENFMLSLSHDEVVYGKGSLINKMPGDVWQKCANLRLLYGYMFTHPGKKLLFMGGEFGQWNEWNHDASLDWHLLAHEPHQGVSNWVRDLNQLYTSEPALFDLDFKSEGFEWIDCNDWESSVIAFIRQSSSEKEMLLVVCNFTPVVREGYRVGVPVGGFWKEMLNSDAPIYGGSGAGNKGGLEAEDVAIHGRDFSLYLEVPPLSVLIFKRTV